MCLVLTSVKFNFSTPNDAPGFVLHQDHLITRFLTDVFIVWIIKPDRQRVAGLVVKHFHLGYKPNSNGGSPVSGSFVALQGPPGIGPASSKICSLASVALPDRNCSS